MASDKERAKEWEASYHRMKARAEKAEARVLDLEKVLAERAVITPQPLHEPLVNLVQVGPGQWTYRK